MNYLADPRLLAYHRRGQNHRKEKKLGDKRRFLVSLAKTVRTVNKHALSMLCVALLLIGILGVVGLILKEDVLTHLPTPVLVGGIVCVIYAGGYVVFTFIGQMLFRGCPLQILELSLKGLAGREIDFSRVKVMEALNAKGIDRRKIFRRLLLLSSVYLLLAVTAVVVAIVVAVAVVP